MSCRWRRADPERFPNGLSTISEWTPGATPAGTTAVALFESVHFTSVSSVDVLVAGSPIQAR